jgi:hypothetical protein
MLRRIVKASSNRKIGVRQERSPSAFAVNALVVTVAHARDGNSSTTPSSNLRVVDVRGKRIPSVWGDF